MSRVGGSSFAATNRRASAIVLSPLSLRLLTRTLKHMFNAVAIVSFNSLATGRPTSLLAPAPTTNTIFRTGVAVALGIPLGTFRL